MDPLTLIIASLIAQPAIRKLFVYVGVALLAAGAIAAIAFAVGLSGSRGGGTKGHGAQHQVGQVADAVHTVDASTDHHPDRQMGADPDAASKAAVSVTFPGVTPDCLAVNSIRTGLATCLCALNRACHLRRLACRSSCGSNS